MKKPIKIVVEENSLFDTVRNKSSLNEIIPEFIRFTEKFVMPLNEQKREVENNNIAEFDYKTKTWKTGKFIGKAIFEYNKKPYEIEIKPRFGENHLLYMLEDIFNIKLFDKLGSNYKEEVWLKTIIAKIWLRQIAKANKFGLPKENIKKIDRGYIIKGKLDIRRTIIPFYNKNEIVSKYTTKEYNKTILQILNQTKIILKKHLKQIPESVIDVFDTLNSLNILKKNISKSEYKKIKYKSIYSPFKSAVDLSWNIINNKNAFLKDNYGKDKSFGLFIDMTEVWELYIERILKKNLSDWRVYSQKEYLAYENKFFKKKIIPDFVLEKNNKIIIFDAKYKNMSFKNSDFDREDFFQINTYISYFNNLNNKEVVGGGLLYPLKTSFIENIEGNSDLWLKNNKIKFIIDGIIVCELEKNKLSKVQMEIRENEFIKRIENFINQFSDK